MTCASSDITLYKCTTESYRLYNNTTRYQVIMHWMILGKLHASLINNIWLIIIKNENILEQKADEW